MSEIYCTEKQWGELAARVEASGRSSDAERMRDRTIAGFSHPSLTNSVRHVAPWVRAPRPDTASTAERVAPQPARAPTPAPVVERAPTHAPSEPDNGRAFAALVDRAIALRTDDDDDDGDDGGGPPMAAAVTEYARANAAVVASYSHVNPWIAAAKKDLASRWQCSVDSLTEMVVRDHAEKLEREANAAHFARVKREAADAAIAAAKAAGIVDGRSYGGEAAALIIEKQMNLANMIADAIAAQQGDE